MAIQDLFGQSLKAVNVGLESFAESLRDQGVEAIHVDWRPPLEGYVEITHTQSGVDIDAANAEAVTRIRSGRPLLVGMGVAKDVIPGLGERMILHAGPPITWERMCGPTRGAVMGAAVYEGWAADYEQAAAMAAAGEFTFDPCHHHHTVGPMAGIVSPSMPVFIVQNETFGNLTYGTQNEGLGRVLRYGAYGEDVIERLKWMEETLYPALKAALKATGPIDLRSIIAQALHMGDEVHNRNRAATSLFIRQIAPALIETSTKKVAAEVLKFIDSNDHFFLNLSMAAMKAMLEPAEGIAGCTLVTVMARNGTDFGIRVASLPEQWFTAPAPIVQGLWLPGLHRRRRQPGHRRFVDHGDGRRGRLRDGGGPGDCALRRRDVVPGAERHAGNVPDHGGRARAVHRPRTQLPGDAARHRRAQGDGDGDSAVHQHRHRAQEAGRGHGRCGISARAAAVLRAGVQANSEGRIMNIDADSMPTPLSALRGCGRRLASLALFAIVPLLLLYIFGFSIKTSEEYACVLDTAERSAQVIEITGEPVTPGLFAWTSYFESGGGERQGQFSTSLSGPRGKGRLQAQFYRTPVGATLGIWVKAGGEESEVYNGAYPCP